MRSPVFIHPVFKGEGKFFMVISQFQDNHCLFTYLEDYKKNPQTAGALPTPVHCVLRPPKKFFWLCRAIHGTVLLHGLFRE